MKTLRAYLRREVLAATGVVLLAFLALFGFFDLLSELENIGRGSYRLKHAFIFVLLRIPGRAYEVMPIAVLIGCLYALTQLARGSELSVMRTAGVSTLRLLGSLLRTGLVFVALTLVLGEFVSPPLERAAQKWRLRTADATAPQELRTGTWVRDGNLIVNARRVSPDAGMEEVRLYEFDAAHRILSISEAKTGRYSRDSGWVLAGVRQTVFEAERTQVVEHAELQWKSSLTPDMISTVMITPDNMSIRNLYRYIDHLESNKQATTRYEVAMWKKLFYPLTVLVMIGLALPFSYGSVRAGGVSMRLLAGVFIGLGFHLVNSLLSKLGVLHSWPAVATAAAPAAMFLLVAIAMVFVVERR